MVVVDMAMEGVDMEDRVMVVVVVGMEEEDMAVVVVDRIREEGMVVVDNTVSRSMEILEEDINSSSLISRLLLVTEEMLDTTAPILVEQEGFKVKYFMLRRCTWDVLLDLKESLLTTCRRNLVAIFR